MDPNLRSGFKLEEFSVHPLRNEIIGPRGSAHIPPKAMDVLCCLAANAAEVVEREEILEQVWGRTVIADDVLTRCISELRSAFGDTATAPRFIQTVPKRGYRLVCAVASLTTAPAGSGEAPGTPTLWEEIKQRSVFRVGMAYAAIAWVVIQLAETTFPYLGLSDSSIRFTVIAALVGLPIALVLAWLYELTPRGIVRDRGDRRTVTPSARIRRLDLLTIAAVLVGVSVVVYQQAINRDQAATTVAADAGVGSDSPGSENDDHGIAILPFENLSGSPEKAYIGDGLAEDLIHLLAKSGQLRVSPRVASFFYKGKDVDVTTIAERLQVDTILTGSVRISDDTIIVVTQLLDMGDGAQIWSERIVKPLGDIFELQNEIAQTVVGKLRYELDVDSPPAISYRPPTEILGAYEFFAQAREYLRRPRDEILIDSAEGLLNRALELDPNYAEAYALLCEAHLTRYEISYASDTDSFESARNHCAQARSLDETNSSVNLALGILYQHSGQYDKSKKELRLAIEQSPRLVDAYIQLGLTLNLNDEAEEAEQILRQSVALDPGYFASYWEMGNFLMTKQRFEEARDYYRVWAELTPTDPVAFNNVAGAYFMLNDFERASRAWERSLDLRETRSTFTNLGLSYYYEGRFDDAVEMQRQAVKLAPTDHRIWGRLAESARFVDGLEEESRAAYNSAIEFAAERLSINPRDWETLALLSLYQAHAGQTDRALTTLGKGLALAKDQPDMHYFAALTYLEIGNLDDAYSELQTSLELGFSPRLVTADPDIAPLLAQERFQTLLLD